MIYGSVCSGIESASMAWEPLGMLPAWFAEVEAFPSAVLAHHWPHVANFGDMCNLPYLVSTGLVPAPDVLVGGTPCQAFSVAGLRKGLEDERGQLTLKFVELANEIDKQRSGEECVVVWENVPGVLSSKDNAFGCFLGALAGEECELKPTGKKWSNAGLVYGPERTIAWRVLDAQYFGVAQRRRRVFVVASARNGFDPGAVLFESEGLRRDTPPSREKEKEVTRGVENGSHWDSETNAHPTLNQSSNAGGIGASNQEVFSQREAGLVKGFRMKAFGEYADDETASTMKARDYKDATDLVTCFDSRQDPNVYGDMAGPCSASTPVNAVAFAQNSRDEVRLENGDGQITGALSTGGGKPGQGYPAVVYPIHDKATRHAGKTGVGSANGLGIGKETDPVVRVGAGDNHAVASFKPGQGAKAGSLGYQEEISPTLTATDSGTQRSPGLLKEGVVRRLTPVECERLQGFPDNHTRIPWRGKAAEDCPDGPRYKAIGNSKAVPVIRFVGERIIKELFK